MTSLEGLPDAVGNDVYLNNNLDIASLEGLPKLIGGNLDLKNVSATSIPDGLDIGTIHLTHTQTELRADCNTKNYNVRINH